MKRSLLVLVAVLAFGGLANAQAVFNATYGVARTFPFALYNTDGTLDVDEVDGGAEVTVECLDGTPGTATDDFDDEGSFYDIDLTAAEMACTPGIAVTVAATDTNVFFIDTAPQGAFHYQVIGATGNDTTHLHLDGLADQPDGFLAGMAGRIYDGSGNDWYPVAFTNFATSGDLATVSTLPFTPEASVDYVEIWERPLDDSDTLAGTVWADSSRTLTALDEDDTTLDLDGSNVGGIAGTITTLDGLDTAQDTQHSTTQTDIATAQADIDLQYIVEAGQDFPLLVGPFRSSTDHLTAITTGTPVCTRAINSHTSFSAMTNTEPAVGSTGFILFDLDGTAETGMAASGGTILVHCTLTNADDIDIAINVQ